MALPNIMVPTFDLVQPSTGEKIEFRPFLVKEEKILLIAKESGEHPEILRAIRKIINACVLNDGFDINKCPIFDLEYIFIKIRSKSVDNIARFEVTDSDDGKTYPLEVDLEEVEILRNDAHTDTIMLDDKVGVKMKYPVNSIADKIEDLVTTTEVTYETIVQSVDYVFDEENVYPWLECSQKERDKFLEQAGILAYDKIQEFFDTMPRIEHIVKYTNSQGKEKQVAFRTIDDFFILD